MFQALDDGHILLQRPLDRETLEQHVILVQVSDSGYPRHTVTATLAVTVTDINDNPPYVSKMQLLHQPKSREKSVFQSKSMSRASEFDVIIVEENSTPRNLAVVTLDDPDDWDLGHGPPFTVKIDPLAPIVIQNTFAVSYQTGELLVV